MTARQRGSPADDVPASTRCCRRLRAARGAGHFTITRSPIERVAQAVAREATFVLEHAAPDGHTALAATLTVRFPWVSGERHRTPYPFLHWFAVAPAFTRQAGHAARTRRDQFLAAQVKAPATYLATAIHHPWLQSYYERGGYVPFDRSTNALGTPLVWLRKS